MHPFDYYLRMINQIHWDYINEINSLREKINRSQALIEGYRQKINNNTPNHQFYQALIKIEEKKIERITITIINRRSERRRLASILLA